MRRRKDWRKRKGKREEGRMGGREGKLKKEKYENKDNSTRDEKGRKK